MNSDIKKMLGEFCDLFGNCLCIISLMLSSYLILINVYHQQEISAKYYVNINTNSNYTKFKSKITDLEKLQKKSSSSTKYNINEKLSLNIYQAQLQLCVSKIKESKYYNIDKNEISEKDIYDYNDELASILINACLFSPDYELTQSLSNYTPSFNYSLTGDILSIKSELTYYTEYIRDSLLDNSSYYYTTTVTRTSIYNEIEKYFDLNYNNYNNLLYNLEKMTNWYVSVLEASK